MKITNLEKSHARAVSNAAILLGKIKKHYDCYLCGSTENVIAHHPDYSTPLLVVFLCMSCHKRIHQVNLSNLHSMTPAWKSHLEIMQKSKEISHGDSELFWKNYRRLKKEVEEVKSPSEVLKATKPTK